MNTGMQTQQHGHRHADTACLVVDSVHAGKQVQCNVWCRKQCVCVWCCVCCAVQGCQWITLCQHSPALAALVLAVGSVVYNSKENNNRENNTEDAEDQ